jgi:hypothetical protein
MWLAVFSIRVCARQHRTAFGCYNALFFALNNISVLFKNYILPNRSNTVTPRCRLDQNLMLARNVRHSDNSVALVPHLATSRYRQHPYTIRYASSHPSNPERLANADELSHYPPCAIAVDFISVIVQL